MNAAFWEGFYKQAADKKPKEEEAIARVALIDTVNKTLLMGKRKDNKRWTLTSGHLEPGETPEQGAVREVKEESGISIAPEQLKSIGKNVGKKNDGKPITVHGFYVPFGGNTPQASMGQDPDDEMSQWRWEPLEKGLPQDILSNLHIPLEKDKVIQFALKRFQSIEQEKAAARILGRMIVSRKDIMDNVALLPALHEKLIREGPQQYAQNFDKIEEARKRHRDKRK